MRFTIVVDLLNRIRKWEVVCLILEETVAMVAMALFLACLAVWAATLCRLL